MSVGAAGTGIETSTAYQREKAEKESAGKGGVSKMDFMRLLTEQLTHQDPLNPSQDIDFTAQLAQLQALDEQISMTKTMKSLRTDTQMQAGTGMIGKYVSGTDAAGGQATGLVERVVSTSDGVFCELANKQRIPVENINNIWNDATGMAGDIASSSNIIDMWIEAGYDEAFQPIQGIVQSVGVAKDGTVILNLYGGKSVSWDKVDGIRKPTESEKALYGLKDSVREQLEKASGMMGSFVTARDANGNTVSGVIGPAGLSEDGKSVLLGLMTGGEEYTVVTFDNIVGEARQPTAEEALKAFKGFVVSGLDRDALAVEGIVIGVEDGDDGLKFVLDTGQRVYYDTINNYAAVGDDEEGRKYKGRLIGCYAEGITGEGNEAKGFIVKNLLIDGEPAVKLSSGKTILNKDLTLVRNPTEDEQDASDAAVAAEMNGGGEEEEEEEGGGEGGDGGDAVDAGDGEE